MQDRYAGDIGDFAKLTLLQRLARRRRLGVAWWLTPNQLGNEDGRYTTYLQRPGKWRELNEPLFDELVKIVGGVRSVAALQEAGLLPNARFADEPLDSRSVTKSQRSQQRKDWLDRVVAALQDCDLLFLDPDNGIEADGYDVGDPNSNKSVTLDELVALQRPARTLIVYHHQSRRSGGHLEEIDYLHNRLRTRKELVPAGALRASPWSPRAFFLLNATPQDIATVEAFTAGVWREHCTWYPAHRRAADQPLPRRR